MSRRNRWWKKISILLTCFTFLSICFFLFVSSEGGSRFLGIPEELMVPLIWCMFVLVLGVIVLTIASVARFEILEQREAEARRVILESRARFEKKRHAPRFAPDRGAA